MSIKINANRELGTIHVTQNFLGVVQGAQIKSGPKAPTDLNAALFLSHAAFLLSPGESVIYRGSTTLDPIRSPYFVNNFATSPGQM